MSGKYTQLRGKLPAFIEEQTYQAKIDAAKQLILGTDNADNANVNLLARLFASAKATKDTLEDQLYDANVQIEALSQLLVEQLEEQSLNKVELSSGALIYLQDTPYPVVKDREALMAWIKKERMSNLLSVNYQTLKGLTNERLVNGIAPPSGVEVFLKTQARLRNGKEE